MERAFRRPMHLKPAQPAPPIVLTIAGFDPSSGAGVTADLQVFAAHRLFGTAAVTALTVQSTRGVWRVQPTVEQILRETLQRLEEDLPPVAIKIGMLGTLPAVRVAVEYLREVRARREVYVVLDPVLRSSSGTDLLDPGARDALWSELLPLCDCATPNRAEVAALLGRAAVVPEAVVDAAIAVQAQLGGRELVVTGGDERKPDDLVLTPQGELSWLRGEHIETRSTHGTGCAFASALVSERVHGRELADAALRAKAYVTQAIVTAPGLGSGRGPLNLLWPLQEKPPDER